MGGTGSGKTSGSGRAVALSFLRSGYGGLVLCAKPGERQLWQNYAKETGREKSLIVFGGDGLRRFNFLDYELRRGDRLVTHNLVSLFMRIMEAAKRRESGGGGQTTRRPKKTSFISSSGMRSAACLTSLGVSIPRPDRR